MGVKVRAPCSVAFTLQISRGKKYTWTNVHKDAIFNSFTVGCIPISLSLINACAFDRPVLMGWICSLDRAFRFRAHNTFAEQKVIGLHP